MSTRSMIAATLPDGNIRAVYCHSNGYPSYNGVRLMNHWHSTGRAALLTSLGDMSSLGKITGKKHDFNWQGKLRDEMKFGNDGPFDWEAYEARKAEQPQVAEDWCLFYHRDRGDPAVQFGGTVTTVAELEPYHQAYQYLWRHETWWMLVGSQSDPERGDDYAWEHDPENPDATWVTLFGVIQRDPDVKEAIRPSPAPLLRKRSIRLWQADVPSTEPAAVRSTGRRATMI